MTFLIFVLKKTVQRMIYGVMTKEVKLKKLSNLNVKMKMTTEKKKEKVVVVMAVMTMASPVVEELE
jgi:hypothetical protein